MTDKEEIDYEQQLKDQQEEYNNYLRVVLGAQQKERETKRDYEDAKFVREMAEKSLEGIKQNIITTKKLLDSVMR
jgi:hypothetical protein